MPLLWRWTESQDALQGMLLVDQADPAVLREAAIKDAAARTFAATALRHLPPFSLNTLFFRRVGRVA